MMNCKDTALFLPAYLNNELEAEDLKKISKHLDNCLYCRRQKKRIAFLLSILSEFNEDVPYILNNRLLQIPDSQKAFKQKTKYFFVPKWVAVALGTILLFFNLFYFTNLYPAANKEMHNILSGFDKLISETGGLIDKIKDSKGILFYSLFEKESKEKKGK